MVQQLGHPGAGADVAVGVAGLADARAPGGAGPVAAADGHRRSGQQPALSVDVPGDLAPHVVALQDRGHPAGIQLQFLQQVRGPLALVDVQGDGQRGVGIVGVAHAPRQAAVEVVLDVHEPAGPAVHLGLVLLQPEDLWQRIVGVGPVAGQAVEVLEGHDLEDARNLRLGAAVGVDDVGVQRLAALVHGDAAVHRARQAHAGDPLGGDLLQQLPYAVQHGGEYRVRVLLGPVGVGVLGGIASPHRRKRLAPGVEQRTFAAGGAGVTGQYQVFFHGISASFVVRVVHCFRRAV